MVTGEGYAQTNVDGGWAEKGRALVSDSRNYGESLGRMITGEREEGD